MLDTGFLPVLFYTSKLYYFKAENFKAQRFKANKQEKKQES